MKMKIGGRDTWFQTVCKVLDVIFVRGLRKTRENAEIWEKWGRLRERLATALFASIALAPMLVVTCVVASIYRQEVRDMPDFIRVVQVEAVIFLMALCYQTLAFAQCVMFKAWLKLNSHV